MRRGFRGSLVLDDRRRLGIRVGGLILLAALLTSGCASMNQRCSYYPDGILESYRLRSAVLGTGETEVVTTDCAALGYSTKDTGLSDNGKAALEGIAEGVARGAVGALVPIP